MTDVTIIVATYERPEWCEVALRSAIATAEMAPVETRVLLLDNAGPGYAETLATKYDVDFLRMPTNTAEAAPSAFRSVDSTYAAILYDDDVLLPNWLPAHLAVMEQGYDVVAGSFHLVDANLQVTSTRTLTPVTFEDLRAGIVSANDGSLIRMSALEGVEWEPGRGQMMWYSMWLRLASLGRRFGVVTEPTWLYRQHDGMRSAHFTERDHADRAALRAVYA